MGGKPAVAFLGPKASYTHQATVSQFSESKYNLQPQISIEDVFSAVQTGTASHGVVPFENSSNGSVVFTLDLFADLNGRYPDILVEGEIYIPVRHCLLGHFPRKTRTASESSQERRRTDLPWRKLQTQDSPNASGNVTPTQAVPQPGMPRVKPGCDLKHVRKLYSHPQAWGQCKLFLSTYLKGVERQDVSSTSKAAEFVAQDSTGTSAAISSKIAAEMNGLDVLAEGIEDNEGNSTRFFILRRTSSTPPTPTASLDEKTEMEQYKSLISFTISHEAPGALADSLAVFKRHDLNLTSINTRPSGELPWHYIFFVELKGKKRDGGEDGAVNRALGDLGRVATNWRWLGSWENQLRVKG
ncbi:Bifunctional chorismate mutase/prephenate dehydratase [Fulvia fulva]|uniref:prephenate dehydratase n=1 Tax=Passalora fulva TaxID=5499 RepID=A0A9Q8LKQ3_PASFU|nr:Bifunctional chorismate mutase/prephenate dehydratase [Fulvia fulva]KAK4621561.1 Bifunctional chorismate mutase/prephenate dehydratase [Fulvia fulva]KAK4622960.1 Bifunctional chorismate mutase/prephenate dehydratase [Fulvia fulva]UJO18548.1 Bifunctional chorismate mutase/prephenate dehydratase [Fulvia fulva]WPV16091.1 Bifunctional chorismate mutase/prephenate dehydratase [Fulvia fulva]WPV31186.1 Bifunctional chorismate mutase/prephenate dehydratase [Fulvia fulva]